MKKKTIRTLLLIAVVLAFFITPLGYHSKVWLNRLFSKNPEQIPLHERDKLPDYSWKLKDAQWDFFNFDRSTGKVIFINFWASWKLPSAAELEDIQTLYDTYGNRVDFYIITNEERPPVEEFMIKNKFTFPVTYLIIGERAPMEIMDPPATYIIDRDGYIVVREDDIRDWDNTEIHTLLGALLQ
ncbi:MAG: TlpA disulfide reductase family protein [Bacteroidota bacterium]